MKATLEKPVITSDESRDVCCPEFNVSRWKNKTHIWTNKLFLKDSVPELFHIPLPGTYRKAITRMWKKAEEADALPELKDTLILAYDPSAFKSELFMAVTKEIPNEECVKLSGTFFSRVFDGPYNNVPKYIKETEEYLDILNMKARRFYFYFAYCPKCAKKYEHNYIVALADVTASAGGSENTRA